MHAIVRQGKGKYYISAVFGYYSDVKSEDDYQRYLERIHTPYYVVFNEEKTKLIKWFNMQPDTKYLIKQVLIIDTDESGWIIDEQDGTGGVEFIPRELADKIILEGTVPNDIMLQCKKIEESPIHIKSIVRLKHKKILRILIVQPEIFTMHVLKNKKY